MTNEDRNIKLKHLITCMKCEVSGKVCDENCPTQYEAGNMGEIIENLEAISEILKQKPCEDWYDVPSDEMTLQQARQAVKDLRKKLAEYLAQQPCEDCISRQAVDELSKELVHTTRDKADFLCNFWEGLQKLPSVTPKEKTGHWEYVQYDGNPNIGNLHCSECNRIAGLEYNYCPNCGARMVSE